MDRFGLAQEAMKIKEDRIIICFING